MPTSTKRDPAMLRVMAKQFADEFSERARAYETLSSGLGVAGHLTRAETAACGAQLMHQLAKHAVNLANDSARKLDGGA